MNDINYTFRNVVEVSIILGTVLGALNSYACVVLLSDSLFTTIVACVIQTGLVTITWGTTIMLLFRSSLMPEVSSTIKGAIIYIVTTIGSGLLFYTYI